MRVFILLASFLFLSLSVQAEDVVDTGSGGAETDGICSAGSVGIGSGPLRITSGPDKLSYHGTYGAEGGVRPYKWFLSCGDIDINSGYVTSIDGCCGGETVTVIDNDEAPDTDHKDVGIDDNSWVTINSTEPNCVDHSNCKGVECTAWEYEGNTRKHYCPMNGMGGTCEGTWCYEVLQESQCN